MDSKPQTTEKPQTPHVEKNLLDLNRLKYTTKSDLDIIGKARLMEAKYIRKQSKDKTLHRVVTITPQFTASSGEDEVTVCQDDDGNDLVARACRYRLLVERVKEVERNIGGGKVEIGYETLGSFAMDAIKFLDEFEEA